MPKLITETKPDLRIPQARVLKALMPKDATEHYTEWPLLHRQALASKAGFNPTTGTINRVLHGIPEGSSSGTPHEGLLDRGLIKLTVLYLDGGIVENAYRITAAGIRELQRYMSDVGRLPTRRAKELCVNDRYQG